MYTIRKSASLLATLLAAASGTALAVPFAVEGKLTQLTGAEMICNGVPILINDSTVFSTPSGTKPRTDMLSGEPFPGRASDRGFSAFIGGTCIVDGDDGGAGGSRIAGNAFFEVAENVLVGPTTNNPGTPYAIMGVEIVLLQNNYPDKPGYEPMGRIVAGPVMNGFGQEVLLETVPRGDESSAEGYMGSDGKFYASLVETTGGTPVNPLTSPTATVLRGDVTFSNANTVKLEIRGGCTFPAPRAATDPARSQPIIVSVDRPLAGGTTWVDLTGATCVEDLAAPGNGTYRYRNDRYTGPVPTKVRVKVAPSAAYPGTEYSAEVLLNRIGFR